MKQRIGILGGGQLAMYLCAEARRLGLESTVLAHGADSPAALTAHRTLHGKLDDLQSIDELAEHSEVITFDVENVPPRALKYLAYLAQQQRVEVWPNPAVMLVLTDKLLQKQWLLKHGLPTTPFQGIDGTQPPTDLADRFGYPFVQKTRRGGYDGRGVQIIRSPEELEGFWNVPSLIEPLVPEARELAVVAARDQRGQVCCFNVAELLFHPEQNVLETVMAPARIAPRLREVALAVTRRTLNRLDSAGVFALELFVTSDDTVLINEISPRVHNSGHHTLESSETTQFEQHLRAICGLPLGSPLQTKHAVMRNILGPASDATEHPKDALRLAKLGENAFVHWYGKQTMKPWRKMGHVTALGATADAALAVAQEAADKISFGN